jgi:teichuronic acid biosynthesis glycosyltransferase TuaG
MDARARPELSVIVGAFNSSATIEETVRSVQAQTLADWELIVVDDGSTDTTAEIVSGLTANDARIKLIRQANAGTASARNAGAAEARGRYWCFLDADDMLLPSYLESQSAFIGEHPGYHIYSCNGELLLADGTRRTFWKGPRFERPFSLAAEDQTRDSSILLMATITPRVFELTGGFRSLHSEDYDFWLRALLLGATHIYNPAVLAVYRRHEGQRTRALVAEAESFLAIQRQALETPGLSASQRAALADAIDFSEARVCRRELEENLLAGEYSGARSMYWGSRKAFPGKAKYLLGLAIVMLSPRLYAEIKSDRMV